MNDWTAHLAAVILGQLVGAALGILERVMNLLGLRHGT